MKIYDVTLPVSPSLPVWPGDPQVVLERVRKIEEGANSNVSRLALSVHTGTHVDAPVHFLPGATTIETLDLQTLMGPALVVVFSDETPVIDADALAAQNLPDGVERVLFKTRNSSFWHLPVQEFHPEFVGLSADAADFLAQRGVRLVGLDYLSIAPYKKSRPTHEALLKAGLVIVEGLDLSAVEAGWYQLVCLPLKLAGSDGAPARVVLTQ